MLDKALTIEVGEGGVRKIVVHRDEARGFSAEPGLDLLRRLLPAIRQMDALTHRAQRREEPGPLR